MARARCPTPGTTVKSGSARPSAKRAALTDDQSRLVEDHVGLALKIARDFARRSRRIDEDELVSEAYYALVLSVRNYDPQRRTFAAYAAIAVKTRLINFIDKEMTRLGFWDHRGLDFEPEIQDFLARVVNPDVEQSRDRLKRLIKLLPPLQSRIVKLRIRGVSLNGVALLLKMSPRQVSRLQAEAVKTLKAKESRLDSLELDASAV